MVNVSLDTRWVISPRRRSQPVSRCSARTVAVYEVGEVEVEFSDGDVDVVRVDTERRVDAVDGLLQPLAVSALQRHSSEQYHHHQVQTPHLPQHKRWIRRNVNNQNQNQLYCKGNIDGSFFATGRLSRSQKAQGPLKHIFTSIKHDVMFIVHISNTLLWFVMHVSRRTGPLLLC